MCDKSMLKSQIAAYDFALLEIEMYLDTHPNDKKAMTLRCDYRRAREALVATYESQYGPYIVTTDDVPNEERWAWLCSPWPWEYTRED